jgi:Na+/H+-dicarboxylate symporter
MRKKNLWWILLVLVLGALVGSALGEVLALILPAGVVRDFFLRAAEFSVGPAEINLVVVRFTLGFAMKLNISGVLGILLVGYILRWS